jgi:uncharacterized membrane protein YgcG
MGFPKGEISLLGKLNGHTPYGGDIPATIWRQFMEQAFALEPRVFPPVYSWPLPKHPMQWVPFHSQFPTYVPCSIGCGKSTTGSGSSGGGSSQKSGGGNSGGPPPTTT